MSDPKHLLTFIHGSESELIVHADVDGLALLISALERLKAGAEAGRDVHDHLKTNAWAGGELTELKGSESGELVHHMKIYGWSADSARTHGFRG